MSIRVEVIGEKDATYLLRKGIPDTLSKGLVELVREAARILRDDSKRRMGSGDNGAWAPPSKWIKAKKGARKALAGMQRYIKSRAIRSVGRGAHSAAGIVYFDNPNGGKWNINDHHTGFTRPPSGRFVTIPIRQPSHLGLSPGTSKFRFRSTRPSVVPARKIWPTEAEAIAQIQLPAQMWLSRTISKMAKSGRVHQLY